MNRTALILALLAALLFPTAAHAQDGIIFGDGVPAGVVVDHDVLLIGNNVYIEGVVNGNAFILGNQVVVSGVINGSLVMLAQNAAIGGNITGAAYAAALTLDLPDTASIGRDLYALTVSLTSKPASAVERHLFALGLDAGLNGRIGGDLHTVLGPIQLYNGVVRLLGFEELTLELRFEAPSAPAEPQTTIIPLPGSKVQLRFKFQGPLPAFDWNSWALNALRGWAVLLVFGLLWLWLRRSTLEVSGVPLRARPWRTLAIGLLVLVISLNLFLVALLLMAVIFAIGLGLNAIGLWPISIALWVLAYAHLFVGLALLVLFITYGTKILVAYHLLAWLMSKAAWPRTTWMAVLALVAGTLIYILLRSLPYVGWVIGLLVIAAGMGSAWLAYREAPRGAHVHGVAGFPRPAAPPAPIKATRKSVG
jgi:hypothetical protein